MYYVGLDVHYRTSTYCILNAHGREVKCETVRGHWAKLLDRLATIKGKWTVCFEATCGYGYLHRELSRMASRVMVAHPGQLRLIFRAKRKNDRVDSRKLAKLLYLDEVPQVYVPGEDVQSWRELIEHRPEVSRRSGLARRVSLGKDPGLFRTDSSRQERETQDRSGCDCSLPLALHACDADPLRALA